MKQQNQCKHVSPKARWCGVSAALLLAAAGGFWLAHSAHGQSASSEPAASSDPAVRVVKVDREDLFKRVNIAAEFRPYVEVVLHAKVSGYVNNMNVDFGDKVKAGDLLATLEVPELSDQLASAKATEEKAEADYTNAHLIYTRLLSVNQQHPNLVAQQDLDTAQANDLTTKAAIAAAKANVERYETLVSYTRITAPFDGVITRRYADPGALIQAGTSSDTQSLPLVRISDNYRLRLDFPVEVRYVKDIHLGDEIQVKVTSMNDKIITGKITRFTYDVDQSTRTMMTEIEVPNPDLLLVPGMYAVANLKVEKRAQTLAIPVEAVSNGGIPQVYVVNADHQIEIRNVQLGLETPDKYEVLSGLKEGDMVVIGNLASYEAGEHVDPQFAESGDLNENKN